MCTNAQTASGGALWPRAIMHVDMDAFYAAVEVLDEPALADKPVIVGGAPAGRGVVCSASYEARAFGVRSAMSTSKALRLCPRALLRPVRMRRYAEVSGEVHRVFFDFTPVVQRVSIDEAFLDVTGSQRLLGTPPAMARAIKRAVRERTGLTASVGVAPSRFVAKIASDLEKPDGLVVIPAGEVLDRLAPLPVQRIWGVGGVTAGNLLRLGIRTIGELRAWPRQALAARLGGVGEALYDLARGIDASPVTEKESEKSVSHEVTLAEDTIDVERLERILLRLADRVAARLRAGGLAGNVVQLKLKYHDFTLVTRRRTLPAPTCTAREIHGVARELLRARTEAGDRPVRLVGVGVSGFPSAGARQRSLFGPARIGDGRARDPEAVERAADLVRGKLGEDALKRASSLLDE